jgi:hypothetical protein
MPGSVRWAVTGMCLAVAGFACTVKARYELRKETEARIWRETVADVSDINGSSSFPYSQPRSQSQPTTSDSSTTLPGEFSDRTRAARDERESGNGG